MSWGVLCKLRGRRRLLLSVILLSAVWPACAQDARNSPGVRGGSEAGPVFSDSGPDAETYGAASGYPIGTRGTTTQPDKLVGTYSHFGEIFPSRPIRRATAPWQFKRAP